MYFRAVPAITPRYWAAITLASIFGANLGDFVSHNLHMGHIRGVPFIAAAFALIVLGAWLARAWEGWYWLAIVAMRTAATNLADLATHDGKFGTGPVCLILAVVLVAILLIRRRVAPDTATSGVPRADAGYWLAMLTAGTIGTALGDGIADAITLPLAALATAVAVAAALGLRARAALGFAASYWVAIIAIRTFGTNLGDIIAHKLSLAVSTPLTGAAMLLLLLAWRERPASEQSLRAEAQRRAVADHDVIVQHQP